MANSYGSNHWVLDTAGEILALGNKIRLQRMEWHPNAVDNDLDVRDGGNKTIWKTRTKIAAGANSEEIGIIRRDFGDNGKEFSGFDLETIDGGTLYVFFK